MEQIILEGNVTSGMQKAGKFLKKDTYKKQYKNKLGFMPYYGTLNVKLKKDYNLLINKLEKNVKIINGNENLGNVQYIHAKITNDLKTVDGAILFPEKTTHKTNIIEFISEKKLRDTLQLKDNTHVKIIIDIKP